MSTPQNDLQKIIYDLEILSRKQIEISSELNKLKHAVNQFLIQQQSVPTTSTPKPPVEKETVEHSSVLVEDQKKKQEKSVEKLLLPPTLLIGTQKCESELLFVRAKNQRRI